MKLAEALQERADLNRKIEQLSSRIQSNCLVQEGENPVEDPIALINELNDCCERLEYLIKRINVTNCQSKIDGVTITELIAKKDVLFLKNRKLREILYTSSQSTSRARSTEIKIIPTIEVSKLQKKSDDIAKEMRLLENKIQQANWTLDLLE